MDRSFVPLFLSVSIFLISGCSFLNEPERSPDSAVSQFGMNEEKILRGGLGPLLPLVPHDSAKVELGRDLFFDPILSKDGTVSCASCHQIDHGGADPKRFSIGVGGRIGEVNAPSVFNSSLNFRQFWDGRAVNLSDQISGPIENLNEMATNWDDVVEKLRRSSKYQEKFQKVFSGRVDRDTVTKAIVAFEETLITPDSPFDRYLNGDLSALSKGQLAGLQKFNSYGCVACHQGRNIGGNMFQVFGVAGDYFKDRGGISRADLGRFNVSGLERDRYVFRVPSLRNVALTAPYFHDGSVKTLTEAVRTMARYQLGREIPQADLEDLTDFLTALTGKTPSTVLERGLANEKK